jgi:hypothetical protein
MIGEFCPKVFALKTQQVFRLEPGVVEFGAEASAWVVTQLRDLGFMHSPWPSAEGFPQLCLSFTVYHLSGGPT